MTEKSVTISEKSVHFGEYNPQTDNWNNYIDRLNFCFEANGIKDDKAKRANFFTVCGPVVFETLSALITPRSPKNVTFVEIENILTLHYSPQPSEIATSYKFYNRNQKMGESAADYIAEIRKLSAFCHFIELERMLRDRLVCGMNNHNLQYELLTKHKLSYKDVVDAMLASESAVRDVRLIQSRAAALATSAPPPLVEAVGTTGPSTEPMDINAVQSKEKEAMRLCYRCGGRHGGTCRFVNAICRFCKKRGHIEKICLSKQKKNNKDINYTNEDDDSRLNGVYNLEGRSRTPPIEVQVLICGTTVALQVDTGAAFTIVNERTWRNIGHAPPLHSAQIALRTWNDSPVHILGQATVPVQYNKLTRNLEVIVAKGGGPNLLGRNWLGPLDVIIKLNFITDLEHKQLENLFLKHKEVFKGGLGTYRGRPVTIHLKQGATPRFAKARPVPYAIKDRVEKEIDRLVDEGVLRPTSYSEWATPVVPVIKKSGEVRLCGDYRSTVNQATESDTYPMPTANEIFACIAGGRVFTTLDLDRAYTQVIVTEATSKLLTLNTSKGLYTVHRLAFGVKACPGIFQRLMTALLAGVSGVAVLIDDVIVSGSSTAEMLQRLDIVLNRIQQAGLRLNKSKCQFAKSRVEFLGFVIDAEGIHPAPSKVEAIRNTPAPKNIQQLQAFLGLYNFYERFIPHKATVLEALHRLLDKTNEWCWTEREQKAFETAKRLLTFDTTLVHYDLKRRLTLTCDSSEYGVGAVLSHMMDDGQERPVALSSRTLHKHERRYSQLDKEATAIMFGIQKFHNYLSGRHFTVVTDHKPLLGIFNPKRPIPDMLSPRLTRIAIALTSHSYDIVYKPGSEIVDADGLSRWPLPVPEQPEEQLHEVLLMAEGPQDFPYNAEQIAAETKKDYILARVVHYVQRGWPNKVTDENLRSYWLHRAELSLQNDCLLAGSRVVVPTNMRPATLQILHKTHSGIVQTKALARSYVWWPQLNNDIEELVGNCETCLTSRHMPPKSVHEWITPSRPWSRLHMDFAGPFQGKYFLIIVDAYSKWPEVFIVNNMTSSTVIRHLRMIFATHGLCETLVSDNGTSFVSNDTKLFLEANKIKHITTAPYHPATNGLAERMVQTVKDKLRKLNHMSWDVKIPNMLLTLRTMPCTTTNKSPAELLMNRRLRTLLDTLHPDNIQNRKTESQYSKNSQTKHRESNVGHKVMYRNYSEGPKWLPGEVVTKTGPSHYKIETEDGAVVNRHVDQLIQVRNEGQPKGEEPVSPDIEINSETNDYQGQSEDVDMPGDEIIEIPSSDKWLEMLGIPATSETPATSDVKGKMKSKSYSRRKPY